jgi:hypothetical protein
MTHALLENGTILESKSTDGTIPIRIIAEGKGSSATYTREFLEANKDRFANRASYRGHPDDITKPWKRDVALIAGRTGKIVEYKVVDGVAGLYTSFKPKSEYRELVEEFGDLFGVSVFAPDSDGHEDADGNYIVESVTDSPLISVDLVPAAGAGGRIEALIESLAAIEQPVKPGVTPASSQKEMEIMEIKDIGDKLDKLVSVVETFISASTANAKDEVQAAVDAGAIASAVSESLESYDAKRKLIEDAELIPEQREKLLAQAKLGADVAPLIEAETKVFDAMKNHILYESDGGRVLGTNGAEDWTVAGVRI